MVFAPLFVTECFRTLGSDVKCMTPSSSVPLICLVRQTLLNSIRPPILFIPLGPVD